MSTRLRLVALASLCAGLALSAPALAYDNSAWIPMISGNPPMVRWIYGQLPNGNDPQIVFVFQTSTGTVSNSFPIDAVVPQSLAKEWMGHWDDPAPLLWYAQHVDPNWLGWRVFGWGPGPDQHTPLSPQLIATMNAEHFAPSMVGGYDVPGLTAASAPASSPAPAAPAPQSATAPPSPSTAPSVPSRTVSAATPTPSAPTGEAASKPTSSASLTSRPASPATPEKGAATPSATAPSPAVSAAPAPAPAVPTGAPATPVATAAPIRPADPHRPPARPHGFPWPDIAGAVIVAAAGGYGLWRWRQAR